MAELTKFSDDRLSALLESLGPSEAPLIDARRRQLREHVVLLSAFDAASLPELTVDDAHNVEVDRFLTEDCERVVTRGGQHWSLRQDIRMATLAALESEGRLRTVDAMTDDLDVTYVMAGRYIHGDAPPLTGQTVEELQGTALASQWLSRTAVSIPTAVEARARQAIESMLRPLRVLVADGFVDRTDELEQLSDYAEVLPPSKRRKGAVRRVRRILKMSEQPPMLIHGPGGVGKSTLVAKFVLDHIDADEVYRFPFAYLSFDRSELRIEQPLTLLADAASQLAAFFPKVADSAATLAQSARATVAAAVASSSDRRASKGSWDATHQQTSADEQILIERFAALIESAGSRDLPNVWVLDTFEVAQRQAAPAVDRLWEFIERFQAACPRLRVIMCGRAPMDGRKTHDLQLGALDENSALELVQMQLADLDLPDDFLVQITRAVSAQPISLRLAVLLVRAEAERGLQSEERRREVLFRLQGNEVEGVLYRRILDHVEDPYVRKIAHPGLVIRRITPEIIRLVLARPCGLGPMTEERAQELFDLLAREVALVRRDESDGLVQRREIRQLMLSLAKADDDELVARLQRKAVRYFHDQDTFAARVEELYYRLSLGQATATLDRAFSPDASAALGDVIDEFPASSRVYLANKMGFTIDPAVLVHADDLSWARQAVLTARRLLDAGQPDEALHVLTSRSNDAVEPYTAPLEVEALAAAHRFEEAISRAEASLAWATDHHDPETFIDLALLAARITEDRSDFDSALRWLRDAASAGEAIDDRVARCAARVAIERIHRRAGTPHDEEAETVRAALIRDARELTARDRSRNPALIRDLAAEIGEEVPKIAQDALRLTGFKTTRSQPKKTRRRHVDPTALTSSELGEQLSEAYESDSSGAVSEKVTEALQAESDETAF